MTPCFENCYDDPIRARSYVDLGFERTYYLAYRDLPRMIAEHVRGKQALDFGCGTGRSTRFLRALGFEVVGVDISQAMIAVARRTDPGGDYHLAGIHDFARLARGSYDLVLSAFTFDNIADEEQKVDTLHCLSNLLNPDGRMVNVVSSPEIYSHEWASFSTKDFSENRRAKSGAVVKIVVTDSKDLRPVEDILTTDESYRRMYRAAGLQVLGVHRPLATGEEPFEWVSETHVSPWVIYLLGRKARAPRTFGGGEAQP